MPLIAAGVCRRHGKRKGSAVSEKITTVGIVEWSVDRPARGAL